MSLALDSYPGPTGGFLEGEGAIGPDSDTAKSPPLAQALPSAEASAGDSVAGPPGQDNLNLNIPYYSCIARSYYMHIYLAPKKVEKK